MKPEGKVNMVLGKEGWRTPDKAWMGDEREEEEEEEVLFLNVVQADGVDSDGGDQQDRGGSGQVLPQEGQEGRIRHWVSREQTPEQGREG